MTPEPAERAPRKWRGMEREQRDELRRRRLMDTALERFGTTGYASAAIEQLCADANVATRSFYELFGSREALLRALYDEVIGAVAAEMEIAFATVQPTVREQVRGAVATYLEPLAGDERKGRVTQLEVVGVGELEAHRRQVIREFAALITRVLEEWMDAGRIPRRELGLLPLIVSGGVSEALVDHLLDDTSRRRSVPELIDEVTRVWLVVLGVDEAPPPNGRGATGAAGTVDR